jgi:hypothetical protein
MKLMAPTSMGVGMQHPKLPQHYPALLQQPASILRATPGHSPKAWLSLGSLPGLLATTHQLASDVHPTNQHTGPVLMRLHLCFYRSQPRPSLLSALPQEPLPTPPSSALPQPSGKSSITTPCPNQLSPWDCACLRAEASLSSYLDCTHRF